jgi:hypothetical protein
MTKQEIRYDPATRITVPRDSAAGMGNATPGTWRPLKLSDGTPSATVCCLKCGGSSTLEVHTIAPDGTVQPSLGCGWKFKGEAACGWHVWVKLEGWPEHLQAISGA